MTDEQDPLAALMATVETHVAVVLNTAQEPDHMERRKASRTEVRRVAALYGAWQRAEGIRDGVAVGRTDAATLLGAMAQRNAARKAYEEA